jgi:hypothetical protein
MPWKRNRPLSSLCFQSSEKHTISNPSLRGEAHEGIRLKMPTMKPSQPDKRIRLALWLMLYRLPEEADLEHDHRWQVACARHLKWDMEKFNALKRDFPRHWQRMLDKRARRLAYARDHGGYCPEGWTPPTLGEIVRPAPVHALMRRCKNETGKAMCFVHHMTNAMRTRYNDTNYSPPW